MANPLYDHLFAPLAQRTTPLLILDDGRRIAGAAFLTDVHRAAAALRALGVRPGDRVAVQVAKTPEALALYGACVATGAVLLPLNTAYTPSEVEGFVADATPRVLLADPSKADALAPVAARHGAVLTTLDARGQGDFRARCDAQSGEVRSKDARIDDTSDDETLADHIAIEARAGDDLAALLYTSGTTGRSKGAMLTHDNLLSNARTLVEAWRFGPEDVLLHALPIFHTHGLFVACNVSLLSGATMLFQPGFDLDAIVHALPQASVLMGVPTFYTRLLDDPRFDRDLVAHMRLFVSGSAPLLAETHVAFEARTGHRILERYGMTETNMNTSNPYAGERRAGTVGRPLPGVEVAVTDPATGAPLPQGETGMVEVRGPNVFVGYWNLPDKTREELRDNGFFITGDLGRIDADGYLTLVGRQKDLIITGGFNVYPKEVEAVLDELPGVLESAVVGLPHPDFGEAVFAVLVPKPGETIDPIAIEHALHERLARYKQPKAMRVVDALPRNTMGKVQKALLRTEYAALFTAGAVEAAGDA